MAAFSKATEQQKGKGTISIWLDNEMISNPQVSDISPTASPPSPASAITRPTFPWLT